METVIITGASSGIGRACALEWAAKGANLCLAARKKDKLEAVVASCEKLGSKAIAVTCDVQNEDQCRQLIEACVEAFGGIDTLISNAGISMRASFEELELQVLHKLMDINFWGMVYCTKFALPYLLKAGGTVVGVSSIAGFRGLPARTGYSASKFAMNGFLEALRTENMKTGLNVLTLCPGFTASNIRNTALTSDGSHQGESPRNEGKMMQPEEVAAILYKGVVKRKRQIILTSQGKMTVFLNKLFPAFMDKMVYNHIKKEPDSPFK